MDFDPTPWMSHPVVAYVGLISAFTLALKGLIVIFTETIRLIPPLIDALKECVKKWRNGNDKTA